MLVSNPRCEWRVSPVIDVAAPRLTWELVSSITADRQTAYQIQAGSTAGAADLWDSGKVSSQAQLVTWGGYALASRKHVYWRVRVWDAAGTASQWSAAEFEVGLLTYADWGQAQYVGYLTGVAPGGGNPAACIRKSFGAQAKTIMRARLYATAQGVYTPYLNGQRVGVDELAPGWTDYTQRRHYQTFDVTSLLVSGATNILGLQLGDGWYLGNLSTLGPNHYATDVPRGLCALYIDYADGTSDLIVSDGSWLGTATGNQSNDIYNGSAHDGRAELNFTSAALSDLKLSSAVSCIPMGLAPLRAQPYASVRRQELLPALAVSNPSSGVYLFDFGQNHAGRTRLTVSGAARGASIRVRHGEDIRKDGSGQLYTANLRSAAQTDTYICAGAPVEVFEPAHTIHGYRYAELTGYPGVPPLTALSSIVLHADVARTATFRCSSSQLTRIWNAAEWSHRSTVMSLPTDCHQRDERMGWSADAQLFSRSALFLRDTIAWLSKYADDLDDSASSGKYGDIAPYLTQVGRGNAGWGDAGVVIPWNLYLVSGDASILARHYSAIKAALAALPYSNAYGDYLNLSDTTNTSVFTLAWAYYTSSLISKIATVLGDGATASTAASAAAGFMASFQGLVAGDGTVTGNSQCGYVLGLAFGLIPSPLVAAAFGKLIALLTARGPTVGFIGLKYLFDVLADNGRIDLAYSLLSSTTNPSFGFELAEGMTTCGEVWDPVGNQGVGGGANGTDNANSYCHPIRGCVAEWLMRDVAGIDLDPSAPGFANIILRPRPGGGLTWAEGAFSSPRGLIESKWLTGGFGMQWKLRIPPNCTATMTAPPGYGHVAGLPAQASALTADLITGGQRWSLPSGLYSLFLTA